MIVPAASSCPHFFTRPRRPCSILLGSPDSLKGRFLFYREPKPTCLRGARDAWNKAGQMRLALHTWQPLRRLYQFPLHNYAVTAPQAAATQVIPCPGHLRFFFLSVLASPLNVPNFAILCISRCWGGGGSSQASGIGTRALIQGQCLQPHFYVILFFFVTPWLTCTGPDISRQWIVSKLSSRYFTEDKNSFPLSVLRCHYPRGAGRNPCVSPHPWLFIGSVFCQPLRVCECHPNATARALTFYCGSGPLTAFPPLQRGKFLFRVFSRQVEKNYQ